MLSHSPLELCCFFTSGPWDLVAFLQTVRCEAVRHLTSHLSPGPWERPGAEVVGLLLASFCYTRAPFLVAEAVSFCSEGADGDAPLGPPPFVLDSLPPSPIFSIALGSADR